MFCIAFGLSMDYEVFLLSRIKEEHDATGDNTHSVAMGLERTGGLVTAGAALLAVTFLAFGTSEVSFVKLFGIGLALAIVMDATIIRGLLVPAFMRLAGEANWWARDGCEQSTTGSASTKTVTFRLDPKSTPNSTTPPQPDRSDQHSYVLPRSNE
jgi:uncharacterized membrane protein YdfJ with MMPL/SSD domain